MNSETNRAALFGYRLRFSPETQPIRQTVVDHIILSNLYDSTDRQGQTVGNINFLEIDGKRITTLSIEETKASLSRLRKQEFIDMYEHKKKKYWTINSKGKSKLESDKAYASKTIIHTVETLFGSQAPDSVYTACFIDCLSTIFDRLAQDYLRITFPYRSTLTRDILGPMIKESLGKYQSVSELEFISGVERFFRESTPQFDWLKWTFCKNYYSVRALGIGEGSDILSAALYQDASFYLDTNIVIEGLDTSSQHHAAIHHVLSGLKRIGCSIAVTQITIDELKEFVAAQKSNLPKVLRQIPDGLIDKVPSLVARVEARHRRNPSEPSPMDVLNELERAESFLPEKIGADIVDDAWLVEHLRDRDVRALAKGLKSHYDALPPVDRTKTESAAMHDALMLSWIRKERTNGVDSFFLTLDASLPTFDFLSNDRRKVARNPALALYILLPWLGSVSETDEEVPEAYSALLSAQLVSIGTTFSLQEFRMLAELEMDCGRMPAEDVEQCLLYLRREARNIDISKADDREKLHHMVKGFFASPDRKYIAEVSALEQEVERKDRELKQMVKDREQERARKDAEITSSKKKENQARAKLRLTWSVIISLAFVGSAYFLTWRYAEGNNALQKIGSFWWLFSSATLASLVLARWLCRGELWAEVKHWFRIVGRE